MVNEKTKQKIAFTCCKAATLTVIAILLTVLGTLLYEGFHVINSQFLLSPWSHQDITKGGIIQAILGTLYLGIGVFIISFPIGIMTAVYLQEYAQDNYITRIIKNAMRNLAGVPSIIYGLFGFAFFVLFLHLGTSLLAASLTLSCMTLPWIISTSNEALRQVPASFREASYALGATQWQTVKKAVLPYSLSGMLTGAVLGVSRAMGETAPIILVGATFYMPHLPSSIFDKFMALPFHLFVLATQHSSPNARSYAEGTAIILICLITLFNTGIFFIRHHLREKKAW